jgi:hypothetical protein
MIHIYSCDYATYEKIHTFIVPVVLALLLSSVTAKIIMIGQPVFAQGGPSACPDPGQCTCNPAMDVMTDHAMPPPFNR